MLVHLIVLIYLTKSLKNVTLKRLMIVKHEEVACSTCSVKRCDCVKDTAYVGYSWMNRKVSGFRSGPILVRHSPSSVRTYNMCE